VKKIVVTIITGVFLCGLIYSAEQTANTQEFEPYRSEVKAAAAQLKPGVIKLTKIFKAIQSKNQFLSAKTEIINTVKKYNSVALKLQKIRNKLSPDKHFAFMVWALSVDPEMTRLSNEMRNQKRRVAQLPGCKEIMTQIDNEVRAHFRQLQQSNGQ